MGCLLSCPADLRAACYRVSPLAGCWTLLAVGCPIWSVLHEPDLACNRTINTGLGVDGQARGWSSVPAMLCSVALTNGTRRVESEPIPSGGRGANAYSAFRWWHFSHCGARGNADGIDSGHCWPLARMASCDGRAWLARVAVSRSGPALDWGLRRHFRYDASSTQPSTLDLGAVRGHAGLTRRRGSRRRTVR